MKINHCRLRPYFPGLISTKLTWIANDSTNTITVPLTFSFLSVILAPVSYHKREKTSSLLTIISTFVPTESKNDYFIIHLFDNKNVLNSDLPVPMTTVNGSYFLTIRIFNNISEKNDLCILKFTYSFLSIQGKTVIN